MLDKLYKPITLWALTGIYLLVLYFPYVSHGGFMVDDWAIVGQAFKEDGFNKTLLSWFPLLSFRPLAAVIYSITPNTFGLWFQGYALLNLFSVLTGLLFVNKVLKLYNNSLFAALFLVFSMIPVVASSLVFAPVSMYNFSSSFLLWAVSFYLLCFKYHKTKKKRYYLFSYLLILCAFLIYEGFAPLLVLTVLLPLFQEYCRDREKFFSRVYLTGAKYIGPALLVLITVVFFQKFIVPQLGGTDISRFHGFSFVFFVKQSVLWLIAIFVKLPVLLYNSISDIGFSLIYRADLILIMFLCAAILFVAHKISCREETMPFTGKDKKLFLFILILAFFSNILISVVSGYAPLVGGYANRIMISTWITLSLILAFIAGQIHRTKAFALFAILLVLCSFSIVLQRDNYIQSADLQRKILTDCVGKVNRLAQKENLYVIGNVPHYLLNNYNDEQAFSEPWDFGAALIIKSEGKIKDGNTLTKHKLVNNRVKLTKESLQFDDWWTIKESDWDKLYYYEYDQRSGMSRLIKIDTENEIKDILKEIEGSDINYVKPRELEIKSFVNRLKTRFFSASGKTGF